jgi:Peptidase M50B-like
VGQWQYIPVVGQPVASAMALIALVLIAFATEVAAQIVRVAHEGGHMLAGLLFGRRITRFDLQEARGADPLGSGATHTDPQTGFGDVFIRFAGYATPPLVGLIGAHVIANGNSWGVLVAGVVLLLAVLVIPEINPLALAFTVLLLGGILWALVAGGPGVQAALAAGLVWLMLIGGLWMVLKRNINNMDAVKLTQATWIPRFVWFAGWLTIAMVSLWVGGRLLLGRA